MLRATCNFCAVTNGGRRATYRCPPRIGRWQGWQLQWPPDVSVAEDAPDLVGWVARIAAGHADDEAALAEHFAPRVRAMLRGRLRQADAVPDLVQDVLLAVILALRKSQLREPERLPAFVHGVARNVVNNHLRGVHRRGEAALDAGLVERLAAPPGDEATRRTAVAKALHGMAPADREVLQLTLVDGLHPREIAQRLSLPSETVRQRKARALKRLVAVVDDRAPAVGS
jgi:RNA polymerase sigma-70 factor (ECF subfamily)